MTYFTEAPLYEKIADLERQLAGLNIILKDARDEIEAMRPVFYAAMRRFHNDPDLDPNSDLARECRYYEARKPK